MAAAEAAMLRVMPVRAEPMAITERVAGIVGKDRHWTSELDNGAEAATGIFLGVRREVHLRPVHGVRAAPNGACGGDRHTSPKGGYGEGATPQRTGRLAAGEHRPRPTPCAARPIKERLFAPRVAPASDWRQPGLRKVNLATEKGGPDNHLQRSNNNVTSLPTMSHPGQRN